MIDVGKILNHVYIFFGLLGIFIAGFVIRKKEVIMSTSFYISLVLLIIFAFLVYLIWKKD